MDNELVVEAFPKLLRWIEEYLEAYAPLAVPVIERNFPRLPEYFSESRLSTSKVVRASRIEVPPLGEMGLVELQTFERSKFDGITYWDTFFLVSGDYDSEATHFHELVHVIQWEVLGSDFLLAYADGLLHHGYAQAPLERMAYELEELFKRGLPLDVETQVRDETLCLARNPGLTGRPRRA